MYVLIVILGTFLLCWLADKGFTRFFRSQPQHKSGKAVRLSKYYGVAGLVLVILGVSAIFAGLRESVWILWAGGSVIVLTGIGLLVYFLTFGVYYDEDTFLLTTFGRRSAVYRYSQIKNQQLYNNGGQTLIELYLGDGRSVQLQSSMTGTYDFLDTAFAGWCAQRGKKKEDCPFYDPDNSIWFPPVEG